MGPRYTKAIIMLVVGSPVLAAGIVIENSIEASSARSSTVTIARLMIAAGACMVAIGIFICCIIVTTNKKEEPNSRQPSTDVQLHRVRITTAPHSQSQQRGVQLVTYSPLPEAQNVPSAQASRFNRPQVVNSPPVVHFQSPVVTNTPGGHHNNNNHNTNNNTQSGASAAQNPRLHPKASSARNQGSKGPAPQTPNAVIMQNQRLSTTEAKTQRQNFSEAKTQRSSAPEPKSQHSNLSVSKSQSSNLSEAKSQHSNVSETKSQRSNVSETKSQRSNASESKSRHSSKSESKSQRSSASEAKSQRSGVSEAKSQLSSASETKSQRSNTSETKSHRSSSSESKSHRSRASEAKCHRSSASEAKCHRSSASEAKGHRSSPSPARSKRSSNPSATPSHRLSTSVVDSANPAHCTSTPKSTDQKCGLSSENLIYPVNAIDMAKLLTAAKKVMEPKLFDDIAKTYSIVYSPNTSASQELPASDLPPVLGQATSSLPPSAGQSSQATETTTAPAAFPHGTTSTLTHPMEDQLSSQATLPLGSSPSAPPYQGPPPEFDPPPYHP